MVVLDVSALLAMLLGEVGAEQVEQLLPTAIMSNVSLTETVSFWVRNGGGLEETVQWLQQLPISWEGFSTGQAIIAASLVTLAKPYGLSLGDRACLALAIDKNLPVYTADRVWANLVLPVPVKLVR